MDWGCNDYVSLADVLEITAETGALETQGRVKELPAADVRTVARGRWKRVDPRSTVVTFRCSECNYYAHMDATNFCPHCGADMCGDETAIL